MTEQKVRICQCVMLSFFTDKATVHNLPATKQLDNRVREQLGNIVDHLALKKHIILYFWRPMEPCSWRKQTDVHNLIILCEDILTHLCTWMTNLCSWFNGILYICLLFSRGGQQTTLVMNIQSAEGLQSIFVFKSQNPEYSLTSKGRVKTKPF